MFLGHPYRADYNPAQVSYAVGDTSPVLRFDFRSWNRLSGELPEALSGKGWIPPPLGTVKRHSNRRACLPLPCSLSYCEPNCGRFCEVLACKLLQRMAPQVGLESSVKRIFNDMQVSG